MDMTGSQTEQNLMKAFAGESQARNRYTYFADVAAEAGYMQIANLFLETADNERAHAFQFFSLLDGGMPELTASYPAGPVGTTAENLLAAADGELAEWGFLYPDFADVAEKEGLKRAAALFRRITTAEQYHERRYRKLLANVESKEVFRKAVSTPWKCQECGYIHEGEEAPKVCPLCGKPQAFFEMYAEAY
jgi:rubrerythrin